MRGLRRTQTPVLETVNLTKHFPVRGPGKKVVHAVDGVDLELYRGQVVALVGESGSRQVDDRAAARPADAPDRRHRSC